jgi:two-component system, NtrC family, sensor kinase
MKALGEAALDLPWLPPCAASLAALTRPHSASTGSPWKQVRNDPGCVLLLLRAAPDRSPGETAPTEGSPLISAHDAGVLAAAEQFLHSSSHPLMNWRRPGLCRVLQIALQQACLAAEIAAHVPGVEIERAWIGGLLAPLGWLAMCAVDGAEMPQHLARLVLQEQPAAWQHQTWGLDATALTRRLARAWRLPGWLTPVLGHLGLNAGLAQRLGAEPKLLQTVQLAVAAVQERDCGLRLPVGAATDELTGLLGLTSGLVESLADKALGNKALGDKAFEAAPVPEDDGGGLLADLLHLATAHRRQSETLARLQADLDQLQAALEHQATEERDLLHAKKLSALAELAAGAGHEINNPLAVISGQAQYLLKQIELAEEQLVEDPSPTLYLDTLKDKLHKSLGTIIGQAHRVHHVLTDLMQFARPAPPRRQVFSAARLAAEAVAACGPLARDRHVRILALDPVDQLMVAGDAIQVRTALVNLLRNGVEAAPADGWAGIRVESAGGQAAFIVEDSGPGPAPALREHLFDPFFSGRSAGRGRGLGLPTAWRLARHNGGDVRFAGVTADATRFILTLPLAAPAVEEQHAGNGHHADNAGPRNGASGANGANGGNGGNGGNGVSTNVSVARAG